MILNENGKLIEVENDSIGDSLFSANSDKRLDSHSKILVISENSSDIFMVKSFLKKNDGYHVYEAHNVNSAMIILDTINIDLIVVDDRLSKIDGYDMIDRLNSFEALRDIPKVLMLTQDYKIEKKENFDVEDVDFIKKPLDKSIFVNRIKSIIKAKSNQGSYFSNMIDFKLSEVKNYLGIYKSFFELEENILFLYDAKKNRVLETNSKFLNFFGSMRLFNRVISSSKLLKKFVPFSDEANYINHYQKNEWIESLEMLESFTFMVKVKISNKDYSFMISMTKVDLANKDLYIIKLKNAHDYVATSSEVKVLNSNMKIQEDKLSILKTDISLLKDNSKYLGNGYMVDIINRLEKNIYSLDDSFVEVTEKEDEIKTINAFFLVAKILKDKYIKKNAYLNRMKVDSILEENSQMIQINTDPDSLNEIVIGILNIYFGNGATTKLVEDRFDVNLANTATHLNMEFVSYKGIDFNDDSSLVGRLLGKTSHREFEVNSFREDILPKYIYTALKKLNAKLNMKAENNKNIILVSIPLEK